MAVLKFRTSDGQLFEIEETAAIQSITIKKLVEDGCHGDEIPLFLVDGPTLSKVLEWCKQHDGHANDTKTEEQVKEWENSFVASLDNDELYHLLMASNYLNIEALLTRLARQVADMITGKSPEEIRRILKIENDLSPEEEAEIRQEYNWAFD